MADIRYVFNDDFEAPLTLASPDAPVAWLQAWFDDVLDTPIDALVGCAVWTDMLMGVDGKIGQRVGSREDVPHPSPGYWLIEHVQQAMFATGTDLLHLASESAHARGKRCLLGVRVGDAHHGFGKGYAHDPRYPTFIHEHPEYRLTKPDDSHDVVFDYTIPAVREHRLAVIDETLSTHDVDGIELDFLRFGRFVPRPASSQGVAAMTQYVRDVAALIAKHRCGVLRFGKPVLGVRLPRRLDQCAAMGLDPAMWVRGGLVDYLAPADFLFTDFALPMTDYLALTQGTSCRVLFAVQPKPAATWSDELRRYALGFPVHEAEYRALAATAHATGAHGLHTFNLGYEMNHRRAETLQSLRDMSDQAATMTKLRHYQYFPADPGPDAFGDSHRQTLRFGPGVTHSNNADWAIWRSGDLAIEETADSVFAFQCGEMSGNAVVRIEWLVAGAVPTDHWQFVLNGVTMPSDAVQAAFAHAHAPPVGPLSMPSGMRFTWRVPEGTALRPRNALRIESVSLDTRVTSPRVMELLEVFAE